METIRLTYSMNCIDQNTEKSSGDLKRFVDVKKLSKTKYNRYDNYYNLEQYLIKILKEKMKENEKNIQIKNRMLLSSKVFKIPDQSKDTI